MAQILSYNLKVFFCSGSPIRVHSRRVAHSCDPRYGGSPTRDMRSANATFSMTEGPLAIGGPQPEILEERQLDSPLWRQLPPTLTVDASR
jgi:hypothetical protein